MHDRLDALEETWQVWARVGAGLTAAEWVRPTRCTGWDVRALYAHHAAFPALLDVPLPAAGPGTPRTAVDILAGFNAPHGVAHTMAPAVADAAVAEAGRASTAELVDRFAVRGPCAIRRLRALPPGTSLTWPTAGVTTLAEALRIVLLEATVHLLDLQRALGRAPAVPGPALADTVQLLAALAPPVAFVEAATGRTAHTPLPVLR